MNGHISKFFQRYFGEQLTLDWKISNAFFLTGIIASLATLLTDFLQHANVFYLLPTLLSLAVCVIIPLKCHSNRIPRILAMAYVLYAYFPFTYLAYGGLDSPASLFMVLCVFVFGFTLKGKAKVIALSCLILEYAVLFFAVNRLTHSLYGSPVSRQLDFGASMVIIGFTASIITSIIASAYQAEYGKIGQLLAKLQARNHELEAMSVIDPLTGCHNRRYLDTVSEEVVQKCRQNNTPVTILLIDIDHFKSINDTYSHSIGDEILKLAVLTIRSSIRLNDVLVRYGGDEFIVLLPTCDNAIGRRIAERIRTAIENKRHRSDVHFTVSIGISSLEENEDLQTCIDRADANLYSAKEAGRNRVTSVEIRQD